MWAPLPRSGATREPQLGIENSLSSGRTLAPEISLQDLSPIIYRTGKRSYEVTLAFILHSLSFTPRRLIQQKLPSHMSEKLLYGFIFNRVYLTDRILNILKYVDIYSM